VHLARINAARWEQFALIAIVIGVVIRAAWVLALHPPLEHIYSDMEGYVDRAVKLASGGALERYDAFYPAGTHWILAVPLFIFGTDVRGLWGGAVLWWALSSVTPLAMWRFARYKLTVSAAALTAIFASLFPIPIAYAGFFMSETPALALLAGSLWLAARAEVMGGMRRFIASGLVGGLAAANRPALVLNIAVAALTAARGLGARAIAGLFIGTAAVLVLLAAHNTLATGRLTLLSENSGLAMWIGQCDVHLVKLGNPDGGPYFEFGSPPATQRGTGRDYVFPDHLPWDQGFFYEQTLACIRSNGIAHLRTLAQAVIDTTLTTRPWPPSQEADLGDRIAFTNALWSAALPFVIGGGLWLIRQRRRRGEPAGEAVMLWHFACVLVTTLLFIGDPRYRSLYDVFGLAVAAGILSYLFLERPSEETTSHAAG
jgi:4-amino-4-deoxy-L-arabinose transferase-like glycosyltransferase